MDLKSLNDYQVPEINLAEYTSALDDLEKRTAILASSALANLENMRVSAVDETYQRLRKAENGSLSRMTKMIEEARIPSYSELNFGISPSLKQLQDSLSSTQLKQALGFQAWRPEIGASRLPLDMALNSIVPIEDHIQDATNVVAESLQELGLRLQKQMAEDGVNQSAQTKQQIAILENLVTLIAATSTADEQARKVDVQARKRSDRLNRITLIIAIIAAIAAIGQWITPILMHYFLK